MSAVEEIRKFTDLENQTWREILDIQRPRRARQIHPMFMEGLKKLGMDLDHIPDLQVMNKKLMALTGWQGVLVKGLEDGPSFYDMLKRKKFPIGNFVREKRDLNYTPEPDIVHDYYGHIPFFADKTYADFNQKFGEVAMKYVSSPEKFHQFERFYWFTLEFGLIDMPAGRRIFGAGIASSIGECEYALTPKEKGGPEVIPFSIEALRNQEFRIDEMQKKLFVLSNLEQLYSSLNGLESKIASS